MLIKDIKPIDKWGRNLLKEKDYDAEKMIKEMIELPLQKACRIFRKKGIQTVMSSANGNNVLKAGEKTIEKEDVYGENELFWEERPTYEEAGRGYAWIMLDFNSLSDENKEWLFSLEGKKGKNGEKIGEKGIWFVHPCELRNVDPNSEFEKRHIVLAYHWAMYPMHTVILRMPINEETTVEEVEEYFSTLAKGFRSQVREKEEKGLEEI